MSGVVIAICGASLSSCFMCLAICSHLRRIAEALEKLGRVKA